MSLPRNTPEIHMFDTGTRFILSVRNQRNLPVNFSGGGWSLSVVFQRPDGKRFSRLALLLEEDDPEIPIGTSGKAVYISRSNDFTEPGVWKVQLVARRGSQSHTSSDGYFIVFPSLMRLGIVHISEKDVVRFSGDDIITIPQYVWISVTDANIFASQYRERLTITNT